jgi:predicted anti-sigma-YlaC factor YlaD
VRTLPRRKSGPGELSCRELVRLVTDYLEDALAPATRRRFDEHLRDCNGCTTYIDQIRQTIAVSGRIDEDALSPEARETLLAAFRDWAEARG